MYHLSLLQSLASFLPYVAATSSSQAATNNTTTASRLLRKRRGILPADQVQLALRAEGLHHHLPHIQARLKLLGSQHPKRPLPQRRRRQPGPSLHDQLDHQAVLCRPYQGLRHRLQLGMHDDQRAHGHLPRRLRCCDVLLWCRCWLCCW